ncbi:MAG: ABC transporter permease [Myxococcales bacterium]
MNFWRCAFAFFARDAALALSYPVSFALALLGTIGRTLMLWLPAQLMEDSSLFTGARGFLAYSIVGTSMVGIFLASYGGVASSVRSEQAMGTLESVLMTPATLPAVVLGASLWSVSLALIDAGLTLAMGALAFGVELRGNFLAAALLVFLTNLSFAAVGVLSASFAVVFKKGDPFRILVAGASFLAGGVFYPNEILPRWMQLCAQGLPVTHGVRALRGVLLQGESLFAFTTELIALLGFAVVGVPLAIACFAWSLRLAKREGSLLQY